MHAVILFNHKGWNKVQGSAWSWKLKKTEKIHAIIDNIDLRLNAYTPSLLVCCHPYRLKIIRAAVSHRLHPIAKRSLNSGGVSNNHVRIKEVALYMTCKKLLNLLLLKIISFLLFQIAHNKAHDPILICLAILSCTPLSHVPNNMFILNGVLILKAIWIVRHKSLANGQSRKRCFIVSLLSQKQHLGLPTHLLLIKLSFVSMTPLWRNHIKILIFSGTLIFQICEEVGIVPVLMVCVYIDFTVKLPLVVNFQWILSGWSDSCTFISLLTKCNQ